MERAGPIIDWQPNGFSKAPIEDVMGGSGARCDVVASGVPMGHGE